MIPQILDIFGMSEETYRYIYINDNIRSISLF